MYINLQEARFQRKEIWFVGDCQCMLDGRVILNTKPVDTITAEAQAMFLETELQKGVSIKELRQRDLGREFILPLLTQQQLFQNNLAAGAYWYAVIDGFSVPDGGIRVEPIPKGTQTIVLASDGYPILKGNLAASEEELRHILEIDPLLFREYKATKGVQEGYVSYDDRAYVKVRLRGESGQSAPVRAFAEEASKGVRRKKRSMKPKKAKGKGSGNPGREDKSPDLFLNKNADFSVV